VEQLFDLRTIEVVAVASGLLCVVLTVRANIWCWPAGIVSIIAYSFLFFSIRLYADALLQVFFLITSIFGWWYWLHGGKDRENAAISKLSRPGWILTLLSMIIAVLASGTLFSSYTDAHIPYWDSSIAGLSVTAQLLLMQKKLENWLFWIFCDILSIGVYIYKNIHLTALLYAVFLCLAVRGFFAWRKELEN